MCSTNIFRSVAVFILATTKNHRCGSPKTAKDVACLFSALGRVVSKLGNQRALRLKFKALTYFTCLTHSCQGTHSDLVIIQYISLWTDCALLRSRFLLCLRILNADLSNPVFSPTSTLRSKTNLIESGWRCNLTYQDVFTSKNNMPPYFTESDQVL